MTYQINDTVFFARRHSASKGTVIKISPSGQITVRSEFGHTSRFNPARYGTAPQEIGGNAWIISECDYESRVARQADDRARGELRTKLDGIDARRASKQDLLQALREAIALVEIQIAGDDA